MVALSASCGQDYHFLWARLWTVVQRDVLGWPDIVINFPLQPHATCFISGWVSSSLSRELFRYLNLNICWYSHCLFCNVDLKSWILFFFFFFCLITGVLKPTIIKQLFSLLLSLVIQMINRMKKPHVVMLSYNHHRHTSKATLHDKAGPLEGEETRALRLQWLYVISTHTRHSKSTKHCTQTQKCHSPFYATASIVAYAHRSTNPIKLLGRLTEAMG